MKIDKEIFEEVCNEEGFEIQKDISYEFVESGCNRWSMYYDLDFNIVTIEFYDGSGSLEVISQLPVNLRKAYDKIILTQTVKNLEQIKD